MKLSQPGRGKQCSVGELGGQQETGLDPEQSEDRACEHCGVPTPRLFFEGLMQLLLCPRCLAKLKESPSWRLTVPGRWPIPNKN